MMRAMPPARTLTAVLFLAAAFVVACGGNSPSPGTGAAGTGGAGTGAAGTGGVSCDPSKVLCKIAEPLCPAGQVPSVDGSCYGPCVPVGDCTCGAGDACPSGPGQPTCDALKKRCTLSTP
jgi:hypothetical protein